MQGEEISYTQQLKIELSVQSWEGQNLTGSQVTHELVVPVEPNSRTYLTRDEQPKDQMPRAIEEFLSSIGLNMPSRAFASTAITEKKDYQHRAEERIATERGRALRDKEEAEHVQRTLDAWRNFAIALIADAQARNAAVSKGTMKLDPRLLDKR